MSRTRCNSDRNEDLELRLAPSFLSKGGTPMNNLIRSYPPNVIVLDDDDDDDGDDDDNVTDEDTQTRNLLPYSSSWASEEQDLELRLGLGAYFRYTQEPSDKHKSSKKTRNHCAENKKVRPKPKPGGGEVKLRCTICMDAMREETSTICGHVFCRPCITSAVISQRKCPACRMKLSLQHIHRIYLPAATS